MNRGREASRKRRQQRAVFVLALVVVCFLLLLVVVGEDGLFPSVGSAVVSAPEEPEAKEPSGEPEEPVIPEDWSFVIMSTGDIMMHSPQTKAGWQAETQNYDFTFMFAQVAPLFRQADLVIGNLETPLAGQANGGYTGYPMFNAPEVLAENLKTAGFDVLSFANNHSLDRRFEGLCATLAHLDAAGILHTGAARTPQEQERILTTEVAGVKIAFLAATYGTNGLVLPQGNDFGVDYIDENRLSADIRRARQEGAQYVIVMLHWGQEYQTKPNKEQTDLANALLRAGADLILGNHPHVLQRGEAIHLAEIYAQTAGEAQSAAGAEQLADMTFRASGKDQLKFVMYSHGNFVSNQEGMERLASVILQLTIGVDGATGEPYLKEAAYIPIYTQKRNRQGVSRHVVWPLELALLAAQGEDQPFNSSDMATLPKAWDHILNSQPAIDLLELADTPVWQELTGQEAGEDDGTADDMAVGAAGQGAEAA